MARLLRLARILAIGLRFGLHEFVPRLAGNPFFVLFAGHRGEPRAQRLREALEALGPIFVKFGQVLSTRRDLLPLDIAVTGEGEDPIATMPGDLRDDMGRGAEPVDPDEPRLVNHMVGAIADQPGA